MKNLPFACNIEETLKNFQTSKNGLTSKEARDRLIKYGKNELKKKKAVSPLMIFLSQFNSILVWILMAAIFISMMLGEKVDAIVIAIILVFNAVFGFIQEYKAERAIEELKKLTALQAKVVRDNRISIIAAEELVIGDIIILSEGDKVPADARLIELTALETMEASLTGESQPIEKTLNSLKEKVALADRKNMVYSSTIITKGRAKAVVVATGMNSEIGKIAGMLEDIKEEATPLQIKLQKLGTILAIGTVAAALIVFVLGIIRGGEIIEMLLTSVALAVAAVPEGLPAVVTISLALAVQRMARKNSLIRKLPSVETLGSTTVICSDKTGTLTMNKMTVQKYYVSGKEHSLEDKSGQKGDNKLFEIGVLCNNTELEGDKVFGDPTEEALLLSGKLFGLEKENLEKDCPRFHEIPFSSESKYMATFHSIKGKHFAYIKGAPDIILRKCTKMLYKGRVIKLTEKERKKIIDSIEDFSASALRVLGFAYKECENKKYKDVTDLVFVGLQGMRDPPRPGVKEAIQKCTKAGIKVIMITGDHKRTAEAIGKEIGIVGRAVTGEELEQIKNLSKEVEDIVIYARVDPSHKLKIVDALKARGHIVAMTGDGINDAPALKKADIGIAMGITGTDVSKEASDMILVDDHFNSIVNAVEEGRGVFNNIRKFVGLLLSCNIGEVMVIFLASLFGWPLPLIAIQILWINLVTDGLPALALGVDPTDPHVMEKKPRNPKEGIITNWFAARILSLSALVTLATLLLFWLFLDQGVMKAQTVAFTVLVLVELIAVHVVRGHYTDKIFSNNLITASIAGSAILQLIIIYTPVGKFFKVVSLGFTDWIYIVSAVAAFALIGFVLDKVIDRMSEKNENKHSR
ncbi:MAG: calcium-translocating P-type ATPase, SERCA-type [Candidatus Woesearchaeota archaeon]